MATSNKFAELIQDNPMDLYYLAHIYPPTSSQYKQTMRQAANLGCTNAMLVMIQVLGNSNDVNDLQKAIHYHSMIKKSRDSYIIDQVKLLLEEYPQLAKAIEEQHSAKSHLGYSFAHRFFTPQPEKEDSVEFIKTAECKG